MRRRSPRAPTVVQIDATSLSRVFSAPMWLRDLGLLAWFLVGVALLLVGLVWLMGLTSTITVPVVLGAILATVAGPRSSPGSSGAACRAPRERPSSLLGLIVIAAVIALMVFGGIYEQSDQIKAAALGGASTRCRSG